MIYTLAVFFPWLAFLLRGRIFSAIFSFILWVILCLPMIVEVVVPMVASMVVSDVSDHIPILGVLGALLLEGGPNQIVWFAAFFFLWVILTVWCCLVIHGDQRREEIEQLINTIKVDSGKSLHQETQQANKTDKAWDLVIVFCILIGLAVLAVFFIKGKHHSSNDPSNNPKSGVEKLKNPSHIKLKNGNNHSRTQNHPKHKNNKGARG
ncbi:flagellar biosynthesis protein FlgG [Helicobacter pylori]|uniref:flagellar biosynthesis protein FlgG n=1 Tax=Helicobacter pylori TaxID=210 RepID=UPI00217D5271|nr:flagellar biosynthesis protein FlgG [Helicobacter pylori]